ncbi:MAG: right-handed parallel beta-helix repeat-containing protein [Chloroflexaceae bacterium]|nr:right-handed parallel beta-helix repeat-containing protein [Chloroflexaceae bacterium]
MSALLGSTIPAFAAPTTYYVNPSGNDANSGLTAARPFQHIQHALDLALPGDTIRLAPGDYMQDLVSQHNGTLHAPITITGPAQAVVRGAGAKRIIEINHDFLTLSGFTIDGLAGPPDQKGSYRDKLLYVLGQTPYEGVNGLRVLGMNFKNAGGECLRLRYFAQHNEVADSTFVNCGVYDFRFAGGGKNGEAIYIGTAPAQLDDGKNPTSDPDQSNNNWIHRNSFNTWGNECVDIKEGASGNIVEHNRCTGQQDAKSAGLSGRGSGNTFRFNEVYGNVGAGVRLGGKQPADGTNNAVYNNTLHDNQAGSMQVERWPQARICGNLVDDTSTSQAATASLPCTEE